MIVIYDATGVRRQAGQHAVVLNELTMMMQELNKELCTEQCITPSNLKEVIGHNPFEVIGGIILGIVTAFGITR